MPREYQRNKNNPYLLPHNLYMRVLYIIRDYDRLKDEYHAVLQSSPAPRITTGYDKDGKHVSELMQGSGGIADPTADKAMRLVVISEELHAVEQSLRMIPGEYRQGVKHNVMYGAWYPTDASERTYRRWKQRFVFNVAKTLKLVNVVHSGKEKP